MPTGTTSLDQKTADEAFKHIRLWEGFEDTVYADPSGVPHIAAMASRSSSKSAGSGR